jgi:hypothetical protein
MADLDEWKDKAKETADDKLDQTKDKLNMNDQDNPTTE